METLNELIAKDQNIDPEFAELFENQIRLARRYRDVTGQDIEPQMLSDEEQIELDDEMYLEADNSYKSSRED